jgi:hypothetical protein
LAAIERARVIAAVIVLPATAHPPVSPLHPVKCQCAAAPAVSAVA